MPIVRKNKRYETPQVVLDILNKSRAERGASTDYIIKEDTGELRPPSLPKDRGQTVAVVPGNIPPGEENNTIIEKPSDHRDSYYVRMTPTYNFYISQIVIFMKSETVYVFQIQMTDLKNVGEFVFISKHTVEQQPGVSARTSKGGGGMASYSR